MLVSEGGGGPFALLWLLAPLVAANPAPNPHVRRSLDSLLTRMRAAEAAPEVSQGVRNREAAEGGVDGAERGGPHAERGARSREKRPRMGFHVCLHSRLLLLLRFPWVSLKV